VIAVRVLGLLEVTVRGAAVDLGGPRQRSVLARLIAEHGQAVSADRLIEDLYAGEAPARPIAALQSYVSHLRRALEPGRPARAPARVLVTSPPGYAVRLNRDEVDAWSFEEELHRAQAENEPSAVHARLSSALTTWRGPAFQEFAGLPWADLEASRLGELRLTAIEMRADAALRLGRAAQTVADLSRLTTEQPLREEAWRLFALALYQSGRQGDALGALRRARAQLAEGLGVDPGPALRELEQSILAHAPHLSAPVTVLERQLAAASSGPGITVVTGDRASDRPTGPVMREQAARERVPSLLPAGIADFTGRAELVEQVGRHLTDWGPGRIAAPVVVITGQGGAGKTSLAVCTAHELAGHFPDGQLFADLHAGSEQPIGPGRVLERFLRALAVPAPRIPEDLDERAEMYRDLVADRKVLVVLDDAAGESQLLPLLPGTESAAVLITSRHRLGGLAGATHIEVGVLDAQTSLALLGRIAGTGRVQAQPEAAAAVAAQCGHLPLALRVAGARLAERPHWDIQQLADRLADETRRLDELQHGDLAVRASISLTYEGASEPARRLLRRLALVEAPEFSGWVCAALLGQSPAEAEEALDQLVGARLVETIGTGTGVHSQYRLHDLTRVYARERLTADESPTEQDAALERMLGALLYLARQADQRYYAHDDSRMHSDVTLWPLPGPLTERLVGEPIAWFERERAALVAGVQQAARTGLTDLCWNLAFAPASMFQARGYRDDWRETHEIALQAVRQAGHVRGQATILYGLGSLGIDEDHYDEAREQLTAAERLFEDAGDDQSAAIVTVELAALDRLTGRLDDAVRRGQRALANLKGTGVQVDRAYVLRILARAQLDLGEHDAAMGLLAEALRLARAAGSSRHEAHILYRLGEGYLLTGEPVRAVEAFELGLAKAREAGSVLQEGFLLLGVGAAKIRLGDFDQARRALQHALRVAVAGGERLTEARALRGLGDLALASGDPEQAVVLAARTAHTFHTLGALPDETRALALLSEAHAALGDSAAAAGASAQAAGLRARITGEAPTA
jgi:DNA-binding SARP family transcriptional activator/tetratricopeptide (TPR) repeat protein